MTPARALIDRCRALGVELRADGDRLRYRPVDRVDPELRAQLTACKADLLAALAAGVSVAAGGEGFDRDDVSQADDLNILGQSVMRPGAENVKGKLGDKTKAGVANIERPTVRQPDPQGDERVAVQFIGQGTGRHADSIAQRRAESQSVASTGTASHGDAQSAQTDTIPLALDDFDRLTVEAIRAGTTHRLGATTEEAQTPGIPEGWTAASWKRRLHYLADACRTVNPERSAELRQQAAVLDDATGGAGE